MVKVREQSSQVKYNVTIYNIIFYSAAGHFNAFILLEQSNHIQSYWPHSLILM